MYCSCRGLANLSFNLLGHSSITCLSVFVLCQCAGVCLYLQACIMGLIQSEGVLLCVYITYVSIGPGWRGGLAEAMGQRERYSAIPINRVISFYVTL